MEDLITQNIIGYGRDNLVRNLAENSAFVTLAEINWPQDISYHLNLMWPGTNRVDVIPAETILLSFHTEQIDVDWVYASAKLYPNSKIIVLYDGYAEYSDWWPENIIFVRYITWHHQINFILKTFGPIKDNPTRSVKASSLVARPSQFKTLITGWILASNLRDQVLMSWSGNAVGTADNHVYSGTGDFYLDFLARYMANFKETIKIDDFDYTSANPISNSNWHIPAYEECVFNFTNESFHYSLSRKNNIEFKYPGPYFTEKTWKPLIAGCGIIAIGQQNTYRSLEQLGFKFDYNIDLSYDTIPGDIDRFITLLPAIENFLINTDVDELNSIVRPSAEHNQQHILNGRYALACNRLNEVNLRTLQANL